MRPYATLLVGLTLVATACSGGAGDSTTTHAPPTIPATPAPTSPPPSSTVGPSAGLSPPSDPPARTLGIGDTYFPQLGNPGYDVEHYTLDLVFDPEMARLGAVVTIEATATAELDTVNLDFSNFTVSAVFVDGTPAGFTAADEELTIAPATPLVAGEELY